MSNNEFIIEKGILKAYFGDASEGIIVIPEGVTTIQESVFQEPTRNNLTIIFPSTFESTSPDAFKKANVTSLDFSKCTKIKDFTTIALNGYFSEVILPVGLIKLAFTNKDFRIGEIKFADNNGTYKFGDFSHCKILEEISFKDFNGSAKEIILPANLKSFEQGGVNCQSIKIPEKSRLEKLNVHNLNCITVPASVEELWTKNVNYVFFEKTALETRECSCSGYVVENVDIQHITFKDEMSEKGLKYFETSRGLVITELDNDIAKFQSVPTECDNKKIISFCVINPFEADNVAIEEKLGVLKTKMKYMAKQNFINAKNLIQPCFEHHDNRSYKDLSTVKKWLISLGSGLLALALFVIVAMIIHGKFELNYLGLLVDVGFSIFVVVTIATRFIVGSKIKDKFRWGKLKECFKETSVYKQIDEPYRWKAINYISGEVYKLQKEAEEKRRKQAEWDSFWDRIHNGTKEEQQRKALASKLDELNKNIRESNSSSSYNLYDDSGRKIGEIDKK